MRGVGAAAVLAALAGLGGGFAGAPAIEATTSANAPAQSAVKWATGGPRAVSNSIMRAILSGRSSFGQQRYPSREGWTNARYRRAAAKRRRAAANRRAHRG